MTLRGKERAEIDCRKLQRTKLVRQWLLVHPTGAQVKPYPHCDLLLMA
jgi:hypothetical protein